LELTTGEFWKIYSLPLLGINTFHTQISHYLLYLVDRTVFRIQGHTNILCWRVYEGMFLLLITSMQNRRESRKFLKNVYTYLKKQHTRKTLVLTTGLKQTFIENEMQKQ
jgi:hypothetical protein